MVLGRCLLVGYLGCSGSGPQFKVSSHGKVQNNKGCCNSGNVVYSVLQPPRKIKHFDEDHIRKPIKGPLFQKDQSHHCFISLNVYPPELTLKASLNSQNGRP